MEYTLFRVLSEGKEGAGVLHEYELLKPVINEYAPEELKEKIRGLGVIRATVHTPPYTMHKFWARRPWRVFRELIARFTRPGDIILDPFAGGGVTLVEGLILRRKVIAVDLNPLAVKVMKHEVTPLDTRLFKEAVRRLSRIVEPVALEMYRVRCPKCGGRATAIWTEYDASRETPITVSYECGVCGSKGLKPPEPGDLPEPPGLPPFTRVEIPPGDKTSDLLKRDIRFFDQLFTKRNLYMVLILKQEIERLDTFGDDIKSFLLFTLSSTLKWASKMSHRRGDIIEGWALHAYWIYPRYLEVNVWRQFLNRAEAVLRGKEFTNKYIGFYAREAKTFNELASNATYMILQLDSRKLPLPNESVDAVITDPPYGDNVNYAELSDYFLWLFRETAPKEEIVINRTRNFTIYHYQQGLEEAFRECYRVLKPSRLLISTFNSKDAIVVGVFIYSLRRAGFNFVVASPQPYLKAYETTFHALQVDALPYDYVFFFYKGDIGSQPKSTTIENLHRFLTEELEICKQVMCSEREYRMRVYPKLIELFVQASTISEITLASRILEDTISKNSEYFKMVRRKRIEDRRSKRCC